jgi:glutathione S-transferase
MNAADGELPVLHQFAGSHFNEKARWALDWKGVAHRRRTHLPGPHALAMLRLSGQTATPVLCVGGEVIAGSARIVDALEQRQPERPLYPEAPEPRRSALELQARFDAEVGPAVRTAIFSVLLTEPDALCAIFAGGKPATARWLYRRAFPLTRPIMARANGVTGDAACERAFEVSTRSLDFVATSVGPAGYLAGDRFSVADLTAAALLAPLVFPDHPDMARPVPTPEPLERFIARFASHPGAEWVRAQYAKHRPPPGGA